MGRFVFKRLLRRRYGKPTKCPHNTYASYWKSLSFMVIFSFYTSMCALGVGHPRRPTRLPHFVAFSLSSPTTTISPLMPHHCFRPLLPLHKSTVVSVFSPLETHALIVSIYSDVIYIYMTTVAVPNTSYIHSATRSDILVIEIVGKFPEESRDLRHGEVWKYRCVR